MLPRHEVYVERALHQMQLKAEKTRTYSHLKIDPVRTASFLHLPVIKFITAHPHQKPLPLNTFNFRTTPSYREGTSDSWYPIECDNSAILHTGDFRSEQWFLDNLARSPFLQPYLAPLSPNDKSFVNRTLGAINLDTACAFSTLVIPSKEQATTGLVELIKFYPFFINSWTWGDEDILKSISRAFQCLVRSFAVHLMQTSSRYMLTDTNILKERLRTVNTLLMPLSRHSTLLELWSFVNLFKPRRVIPNTLDPTAWVGLAESRLYIQVHS
ncbi:hypothetical protein AX14_002352 [Amanita brunnescens Koide BX004]|nr:hypothetical protein AX14_002352 [Amanita brunnescens Koide BX004]